MPADIQWIGHASFRLSTDDAVVYIDPWKLPSARPDADVVFVSHTHFDHLSAEDVNAVSKDGTVVVGPPDVVEELKGGRSAKPGDSTELGAVTIDSVRAHNVGKDFHPKDNDWLGAVITLGGVRVYYAGDTDQIPDMGQLEGIDVALLPVGGTYTMTAAEAVEACKDIGCRMAVPYHWGDIIGSESDAQDFVDAVSCEGRLLQPGETLSV